MAKSSPKRSRQAQSWMLDGGIWRKKAEIREPRSSFAVEVVCNEMKWVAALLAAFAFAAPPGASGCLCCDLGLGFVWVVCAHCSAFRT